MYPWQMRALLQISESVLSPTYPSRDLPSLPQLHTHSSYAHETRCNRQLLSQRIKHIALSLALFVLQLLTKLEERGLWLEELYDMSAAEIGSAVRHPHAGTLFAPAAAMQCRLSAMHR